MFQIFATKKFLADYLEYFVDVHNHILPGIDDGAADVSESIQLIRGFGELGIRKFVATPHIMFHYHPNTPITIRESLDLLKNAMLNEGLNDISVDAAAEHMIDDNFESILDLGEVMPLRKDHLLVEMSFLQPPINFDEAIVKIASNRLYPVLAHPERYKFLHQRTQDYGQYKKSGIQMQLNLLSLGDYYEKDIQKMAFKLLDEGLIDYVASDVHRVDHLNIIKETTLPSSVLKQIIPVINNTIETFY
jgi:tyrosine-protein phosphatase YwqE